MARTTNGITARFWFFWNGGYVKLSIPAGETVELHRGGAHDEGYSHEGTVFTNWTDGELSREDWSEGRDCDGPHSSSTCLTSSALACQRLGADRDLPDPECARWPVTRPVWVRHSARQTDAFAEAMNY